MVATTKRYKLFAALKEDIAEGFVWFKHDGPRARCVVKITYTNNGRRRAVFCEALQLEKNFLRHYNQEHRIEITEGDDESNASPMVINHWYRAHLGQPEGRSKLKKNTHSRLRPPTPGWADYARAFVTHRL
jgi:hypothetical protein